MGIIIVIIFLLSICLVCIHFRGVIMIKTTATTTTTQAKIGMIFIMRNWIIWAFQSACHGANGNGTWNYLTVTILLFVLSCRCLFIRFNIIIFSSAYLLIFSFFFLHQRTEEITVCVLMLIRMWTPNESRSEREREKDARRLFDLYMSLCTCNRKYADRYLSLTFVLFYFFLYFLYFYYAIAMYSI